MQQVTQQQVDEKNKGKIFKDPNKKAFFNIQTIVYQGDTLYIAMREFGKWQYVGAVQLIEDKMAYMLLTDPNIAAGISEERIKEFIRLNNSQQLDLQAQQSVGRIDRYDLEMFGAHLHEQFFAGLSGEGYGNSFLKEFKKLHQEALEKRQVKKQRPQPEPKPLILSDGVPYEKGMQVWMVDSDGSLYDLKEVIDLTPDVMNRKEYKRYLKSGVHFYSSKMAAELGRKDIYDSWRFNTNDGQSLKLAQQVWVIDKSTKEVFSFDLHAGSRKNSKRFLYTSTKEIADKIVRMKKMVEEWSSNQDFPGFKVMLNGKEISFVFPNSRTFTS